MIIKKDTVMPPRLNDWQIIDLEEKVIESVSQIPAEAEEDGIKLLPALPREWQEGELRGVYLPGGKRIDLKWKNGKVIEKRFTGSQGKREAGRI